MRQKLAALFIIFLMLTGMVAAQEIIIESRKEGKNSAWYSETKGVWWSSTAKSNAEGCSVGTIGSRFVDVDSGAKEAEARFTPVLPKAGAYDIYATWGHSGNALHVKYVINTGTKVEEVFLDQSGWGGSIPNNDHTWVPMGTFDLPAGNTAYVALQTSSVTGKTDPQNLGRVYSDAIKFVPNTGTKLTPPPSFIERPSSVTTNPTPAPISATPATPLTQSSPFIASSGTTPATPTPKVSTQTSPFVPPTTNLPFVTPVPTQGATSPFVAPASPPKFIYPFVTPVSTPAPSSPFVAPTTGMTPALAQTGSLNWHTSYTEAVRAGIAAGKPVFLFFYSTLGGASRTLESDVLNATAVKEKLTQNFILGKLDINQNRQVIEYYGVFKAPVIIFLDSRGYSRARIDVTLTAEQLLAEMEKYSR